MNRQPGETFDDVASLYDQARPGYPAALFDTIVAVTGLPADGKILEIGTGTGKATLPFARRGGSFVCLEPGRNLAAIAAANLRPYLNVAIEIVRFEEWPLQAKVFDLVMAAQAFHWIAPKIGFSKSAAALKETGWLALFWNIHVPDHGEAFQQIFAAYHAITPQITDDPYAASTPERLRQRADAIEQSGFFREVIVRQFTWSQTYTAKQYLDLLNTFSNHQLLPEQDKRSLFTTLEQIISRHGGNITLQYLTVLYIAQKR